MHLQGIRIEYFINGGIAILWFYPILIWFDNQFSSIKTDLSLVFIVPFLYLIGMLISFSARRILKRKKKKIQSRIYEKYLGSTRLYQIPLLIKIAAENKEIYERMEISLAAQLVARGSIVNLSLALISNLIFLGIKNEFGLLIIAAIIIIFFLILCYQLWKKHQNGYYENQCFAFLYLNGVNIIDSVEVKSFKKVSKKSKKRKGGK